MTRAPVLMIHSGGFTSRQWRKLGEKLTPAYEVIAPDLLGYATSGPWPEGAPFHYRQDVEHLAQRLGDREPAHVVGHSYGGFLALLFALAYPARVRSLALYEPVAFGILDEDSPEDIAARADLARLDMTWDGDGWLSRFVEWWQGAGAWQAMGEETRAAFRAVGWKVHEEVATLVTDPTDRAGYAAIAVPTLLLGGERTPLAERRMIAKLAAAIPRATLRVFPGLGHMGPITHAALVNDAIAAFLDGLHVGSDA
jgi:pimeloyl-ACP methyl ester carboxylesterase